MTGIAETFIFGIGILFLIVALVWLYISFKYSISISKDVFGRGFNGIYGDTIKLFCPSDRTICIADARIIWTLPNTDNTNINRDNMEPFNNDGTFSKFSYDATADLSRLANGKKYYQFDVDEKFMSVSNLANFASTKLSVLSVKGLQIIGTYNCIPKGGACGANIDRTLKIADIHKNPKCGILNQRAIGVENGVEWAAMCIDKPNTALKCDNTIITDSSKPYCWIQETTIDRPTGVWNCTKLNSISTDGMLCAKKTTISQTGQTLCTPDPASGKYCWIPPIQDASTCKIDTGCSTVGQLCNNNIVCSVKNGSTCRVGTALDENGNMAKGCWNYIDGYKPGGSPPPPSGSGTSGGTKPPSGRGTSGGTKPVDKCPGRLTIYRDPITQTGEYSCRDIYIGDSGSYCIYDRDNGVYALCNQRGFGSYCKNSVSSRYIRGGTDTAEILCDDSTGNDAGGPSADKCPSNQIKIYRDPINQKGEYYCNNNVGGTSINYCNYGRGNGEFASCNQRGLGSTCKNGNTGPWVRGGTDTAEIVC